MLNKNQRLNLYCHDIDHNFYGVCNHEGFIIFVPGLLPEEQAICKILKVKKRYAYAKIISLERESAFRQTPPCLHYPSCGGCSALHIKYEQTLNFKIKHIENTFMKVAHLPSPISTIFGMPNPFNYRNKTTMPLGKKGEDLLIGFYATRSHNIVNIDNCLTSDKQVSEIVNITRKWINLYNISIYDEVNHSGLLRHIYIRVSSQNKVLISLISRVPTLPFTNQLISLLKNKVPNLAGICLILQPNPTNVILGKSYSCLWGHSYLEEAILGFKFLLSPLSFFQVNHRQAENLYKTVLDYACLTGLETIADIYCGVGTISLILANKAKKVIGIEQIPEAVQDARQNAILNNIKNVEFYTGQAEKVLPGLLKSGLALDIAVVDPPRKGLANSVITSIIQSKVKKIIYISCNPTTQARDINLFIEHGYTITRGHAIDMFCWTSSIETICLLEKSYRHK